jgi:hypothetical protein
MTPRRHFAQLGNRDVGVNLGRIEPGVSKQFLDYVQVGAVIEGGGCAGGGGEAVIGVVGHEGERFDEVGGGFGEGESAGLASGENSQKTPRPIGNSTCEQEN